MRHASSLTEVREVFVKAEASSESWSDAEDVIFGVISAWLAERLARIKTWAKGQVSKSFPPLEGKGLAVKLTEGLKSAYGTGYSDTAAQFTIDLEMPDPEALAYAQTRGAEMVGMKWVEGELVDNPDSEWSITETIRTDTQNKVSLAIEEGWSTDRLSRELDDSLGDARAHTIARTETGLAYNNGSADALEAAEVDLVECVDGLGCTPQGHDDSAPSASGTPGEVELENQANGQVWTLEQFRENLLGHPNCVRAAVVAEGMSRTEEEETQ